MPFDGKALAQEVLAAVKIAVAPLVERIAQLEARALEKGEPGKPGEPGRDGKDGEAGRDGKSITPDDVLPMLRDLVEGAVGDIRIPEDGKDGAPGQDGQNGKDGKDAVGVMGAVIDRDGNLVLNLSDGRTASLGCVIGKDGKPGDPGQPGKDGTDGVGFDDLELVHDGERTVTFRFVKGETVKEFAIRVPAIIYRGVWREGEYERGDAVQREGGLFVCVVEKTVAVPGTQTQDWAIATKRGRDGKSVTLADVEPMIDRKIALSINGLKLKKESE